LVHLGPGDGLPAPEPQEPELETFLPFTECGLGG
jgi:hypothetical protein